jgi:hypothetical protein
MLINEIIEGIVEAPQGNTASPLDAKTRDDIADRKTYSINGRKYIWVKEVSAWYSQNDRAYVRPGSESDYVLTTSVLNIMNPRKKITLNPFKLANDLIAKPIAKRLGLRGIGKATRTDPNASIMKKTGTMIGGAIGRGLDKMTGDGGYKFNRRGKLDDPELSNTPDTPNTFDEPKTKKPNIINLDKKRKKSNKKSSILMPGDPDFRK